MLVGDFSQVGESIFRMAVPPQWQAAWKAGELVLKGSVLASRDSGLVVAHLQQTSAYVGQTVSLLSSGGAAISSITPFGLAANLAASAVGVVQGEQIKNRLEQMNAVLGRMQILQVADLAGTAIGIGVTLASTAIILKRISALRDGIATIEEKLDALPAALQVQNLQHTLDRMVTQLERLESASARNAAEPVVRGAEEALHDGFNALNDGAKQLVSAEKVSPELLAALLNGMAIAGFAQVKALFWLGELNAAELHARHQFQRMQSLSVQMPLDVLIQKFSGDADAAVGVSSLASGLRLRFASQPSLAAELIRQGVSSRGYLEQAESETEAPILFFHSS